MSSTGKYWETQRAMADIIGMMGTSSVVEHHGRLRRLRLDAGVSIDVWSPPAGTWAVVLQREDGGQLKVYPSIATAQHQLQLQLQLQLQQNAG
jgi:hypothetical protein